MSAVSAPVLSSSTSVSENGYELLQLSLALLMCPFASKALPAFVTWRDGTAGRISVLRFTCLSIGGAIRVMCGVLGNGAVVRVVNDCAESAGEYAVPLLAKEGL